MPPTKPLPDRSRRASPEQVAVVVNETAPDSIIVARHYLKSRRIPGRNVIRIACPATESVADDLCEEKIVRPIRAHLARTGMDRSIDYLVTTRGVPLVTASGLSVDGLLMTMDLRVPSGVTNPYFNAKRPFSHRDYFIYLCTRLDGYTIPDAKALVDRSLQARAHKGVYLFDLDPRREKGSYGLMNQYMRVAARFLKTAKCSVHLDETPAFVGTKNALAGYFSWGSNDASFDPQVYLALRFLPGALAETAVSTSARTLRATTGGQSLIADLVSGGVTGVKGYVSEPYLHAVARPDILFPRYVGGFNLAQAFYAASPQIRWKDVVLGDPLCAPYAHP